MTSPEHIHLYTRHLIMKQAPVEEVFDDMVLLPLGYQREGELIIQWLHSAYFVTGITCQSHLTV